MSLNDLEKTLQQIDNTTLLDTESSDVWEAIKLTKRKAIVQGGTTDFHFEGAEGYATFEVAINNFLNSEDYDDPN